MLSSKLLLSSSSLLLLLSSAVTALQVQPQKQQSVKIGSFAKHAAAAACVFCATTVAAPPALALDDSIYGPLETALIDASDATYPVLKSLTAETVSPLSNKLVGLVTKKMDAGKFATAVNKGADAVMGIPDDKLEKFSATVKASYDGVSGSSCSAIPVPSDAIATLTSSDGFSQVDASKLAVVTKKLESTLASIPKSTTSGGLCLPGTKEGLEQLWIGQTELTINIPKALKADFAGAAASAINTVPNPDLLRVLPDAKKILKGVDPKTAKKFESSGKTLDTVLKADARFKSLQVK